MKKTKDLSKYKPFFKELAQLLDKHQMSLNFIGDAYLKTIDKETGRAIFFSELQISAEEIKSGDKVLYKK